MHRISPLFLFLFMMASCGNSAEKSNEADITSADKSSADKTSEEKISIPENFDIQGHRGMRGLMPENTVEGFIEAIKLGVTTIEADVVVTADKKLLFSHEPWFSSELTTLPNHDLLMPVDAENFNIYKMKYDEIVQFDIGRRINNKFPEQSHYSAVKPLFKEGILTVEKYCEQNKLPKVKYNIEIKAKEEWDNWMTPAPEEYVSIFLNEIKELPIKDRLSVQSFDVRILNQLHEKAPDLCLAFLLEDLENIEKKLSLLSFNPCVLSPYYKNLDKAFVSSMQSKGMKVIPWTVNDTTDIKMVLKTGVDGLISDYPNRVIEIVKGLKK